MHVRMLVSIPALLQLKDSKRLQGNDPVGSTSAPGTLVGMLKCRYTCMAFASKSACVSKGARVYADVDNAITEPKRFCCCGVSEATIEEI